MLQAHILQQAASELQHHIVQLVHPYPTWTSRCSDAQLPEHRTPPGPALAPSPCDGAVKDPRAGPATAIKVLVCYASMQGATKARAIEACAAIAIERGDANESELVEVAREALEFRGDASTSTRLAVARACETLGRGREEFLALALEVAREMTRDERGAVARRACASASALFREALIMSA